MPSQRFHNLKQVKKRTFLKMAYKEFSMHSYEGASITRLVTNLKMAKGSIYQYFENKEELYYYLVEHAHQQLYLVVDKTCPPPKQNEDFNSWLGRLLLIQVKFLLSVPQYASIFIKHQAENGMPPSLEFMEDKIKEAANLTKEFITKERRFYLTFLPILIFNFTIRSENIDLIKVIHSDATIEVSTNKLLYLCEAFLQKV